MKRILVIGAGRSASDLIAYLLKHAEKENWQLTVVDQDEQLARSKVKSHPRAEVASFDAMNPERRKERILQADLVVSFLPAHLHQKVAEDCLELGKHLVTASYLTPELEAMQNAVAAKGLTFLCELGADPGIDHMSAMRAIDDIRAQGGQLHAFRSYCGALIAPESNDNPLGYKFTWSPMNLIVAGRGTARYIEKGRLRYIPYQRLFHTTDLIEVPDEGTFESYANRDSLSYRKRYGLEDVPTMYRATLRNPGFCEVWQALVQIGLTDPSYQITDSASLTYAEWLASYLPPADHLPVKERLATFLSLKEDESVIKTLEWIGLLSDRPITREAGSPAEILLDVLMDKLVFREEDTDMLVMVDHFDYEKDGKTYRRISSLVSKGLDPVHTAISRTVGLPAAIGARLILTGEIDRRGVMIPVHPQIYRPILDELESLGIGFIETDVLMDE
ncbi:MAG: saccharopine dehydrogenase C-terminal domain-containing protein [Bacteroidota bacterium]